MAETAAPKIGDTVKNPKTGQTATFTGEGWEISAAPAQEPAKPVFGEDVLRSGVGGLMHGGAQLLGLPFSMADLAAQGLGAATGAKGFENIRRDVAPITGSALEQKGNENVPGMGYKPTSTAGEWAHTAGEWAPSIIGSAFGGGVSAATKAIVSALGSEGLGQLAQHFTPAWETPARIIGALTGYRTPTTAGKIAERVTAPSAQKVKDVADEIASFEAGAKKNQFKPAKYNELKELQKSHPAYTAVPGAAPAATPDWLNTVGSIGGGLGAAAAAHAGLGWGHDAELMAFLLGQHSGPHLLKTATGAATKGTVGPIIDEFKNAPGVTSWMAGSRGIPALDAQFQQE